MHLWELKRRLGGIMHGKGVVFWYYRLYDIKDRNQLSSSMCQGYR